MSAKIGHIGAKGKLATVLVLLVMLPAIFFSVYEFTTLTRSESLIAEVYRQQLDVVLYSLNQYAWDIADNWANTVERDLAKLSASQKAPTPSFIPFLDENASVRCLFLVDGSISKAQLFYPKVQARSGDVVGTNEILSTLRAQTEMLERLFKFQSSGYRKIDPLYIKEQAGTISLALVFVSGSERERQHVVGIVIDKEHFVRDVLGRKMDEAAGENFLLSVNHKHSGGVVYATGEMLSGEARQSKDLWILPDYTIGIRLRGQTIDEAVRSRFYRNLVLIGLLTMVLIAGVWVVYGTVRREVELAQMKSDFVSNVSHEIKTPLSLIRMFGETLQLKRVRSEAKKQEYYNTIVQESERLTRLINNILNFSRMEAGKKEYRFTPVDLNDIVRDVLKNYKSHLEHMGFTVSSKINVRLPLIVADREAVAEALLNIIDNSVKYSREHKDLIISTGQEGATAFVEIADHGIGIDAHLQKKVFEKFYRVSSGLVHSTKGTGLGLALVKHIVDAHAGTITLKSGVGKGSAFRILFPIRV